jgi:hypothetical protein
MVAGRTWQVNITNLILNPFIKTVSYKFCLLNENSRYVHTRKPEIYCIILIIKSKRLRQARHVARTGDTMNAYINFVVKSREMFAWKAQGDGAETWCAVDETHLVLINLSLHENQKGVVSWVGS